MSASMTIWTLLENKTAYVKDYKQYLIDNKSIYNAPDTTGIIYQIYDTVIFLFTSQLKIFTHMLLGCR